MTLITPLGGAAANDLISQTLQHYDRAVRDFSETLSRIEAGDLTRAKEAVALAKDLKAALQAALDERTRVERLRKTDAGIVHDYALDFDAARAEIGRRLACLRDAAGG